MRSFALEICVDSVHDAQLALAAGAARLEVCAALDLDGLTPGSALLKSIRAISTVPIMAMVRPRPSAFVPEASEWQEMADDLQRVLDLGADGLVFGALTADGGIPSEELATLLDACRDKPVTFHRAFDQVTQAASAWEILGDLGFTRVLTSGRPGRAADHLDQLAELARASASNTQLPRLLPGGGVRPMNAQAILDQLAPFGVDELHSSACTGWERGLLKPA